MKVVDSLKLNKFKPVSIPRNRDLYARVGGRIPSLGTGGFTAEYGKDKLQLISDSEAALIADMNNSEKETTRQEDRETWNKFAPRQ